MIKNKNINYDIN